MNEETKQASNERINEGVNQPIELQANEQPIEPVGVIIV